MRDRFICPDGYETWNIVFDGGASVSTCMPKGSSRDDAMMNARKILENSIDWDTRQQSRGRIVKAYKV